MSRARDAVRFAACRPPIAEGQSIYIHGLGGPIPMRHDRTINQKVAIYWWLDDLHLVRPPRIEAEIIGKCAFAKASSNSYRAGSALKIFGITCSADQRSMDFFGSLTLVQSSERLLWAWRVRIRIVLGLWVSMVAAWRDFSGLPCACRSFGCHASPGLRRTLYENRPLGACQT